MRKKSHWFLKTVLFLVVVAAAGIAVLLMTFDANSYKPQIAQALSEQLGREVRLDGPIKLGVSLQGVELGVSQVSIGNPPWASRPVMAKIGRVALGVAVPPLLQKKIDVTGFTLADADVQIESNAQGQSNLDFQAAKKEGAPAAPAVKEAAPAAKGGAMPAFHVRKVNVENSTFALRDKDGKVSTVSVKELSFAPKGKGMELTLTGAANGTPVTLDLKGEKSLESLMNAKWPFEAAGKFATYDLAVKGVLDSPAKKADLASYTLKAGGSTIAGKMAINYGGARPAVSGTLTSEKLTPSDFKPEAQEGGKGKESKGEAKKGGEDRIFSAEPLDLSGLKAADAHIDVAIGELSFGPSSLKTVQTKLDLQNGRLLLSPFKGMVGNTPIEGQMKVDGEARPAQVSAILKGYRIDLSELVSLSGMKSFIESKGDADMDITASGNSLHEMASNANGQINLVMAGGNVSQSGLSSTAGGLLDIFAPGVGGLTKPGLNCLVAHFKIVNGLMQSQGLLADTAQATIVGIGGVNLRDETMDMVLRTRTKGVDVSAFTPPLRVHGPLKNLSYSPDASGSIQNVVGLFKNGSVESAVPDIVQQAGQNACEYTLKNPPASKPVAAPAPVQKAVDKVKEEGGKLIKGLFGN